MGKEKDIHLYQALALDLEHEFTTGSVILDFGCGDGQLIQRLRELGFEAFGTDILLNEETHTLRLIHSDATYRIPFDDRTFDALFRARSSSM